MKKILFTLLALATINLVAADAPKTEASPKAETAKKDVKPLAGKKMVIVVSSGENEKAGMGITLGLSAAMKGADVTIVLGAKALKFALNKGEQELFAAKKMTHKDILAKAVENGANIQVCYMCATALGLKEKDFVEGSKVVKSLVIFNKMYEDGAKVLSF